MNKKLLSSMLFLVILLGGFFLTGTALFTVQAATNVTGIIDSDTTWTKANSPYSLTGNMAVEEGITLTIEPGVTVNLNQYFIRVNGTLTARGTSIDKIHFNDGYLEFTASSSGWDPQIGTGSIIENAVVNSMIKTTEVSLLINNNTITKSMSLSGASPIISKNSINIVTNSDGLDSSTQPSCAIHISDPFYLSTKNTALIVDNTISGSFTKATITIGGSPTIQRNIISNSYGYDGDPGYRQAGIMVTGDSSPIIKQNTITECANGIYISGSVDRPNPTIVNNNIESITSFSLYMGSRNVDVDVANNWWGTTDTAVIDQKIWDYKDDFDLGKVNYAPFLTEANPEAKPDPNAPIPTPAPEQTPTPELTPTPSQEPSQEIQVETILGVAIVVAVIGVGLGLLIYLIRRK